MSTTWTPRTVFEHRSWLLADGSVVNEPPLEESGSGLKVRIVGTKTSAFTKDLDALVVSAVTAIAQSKGTSVWMGLANRPHNETAHLNYDPAKAKAEVHFVKNPGSRGSTSCWWRFKHATLPIEYVLSVTVANHDYRGHVQAVTGQLVGPPTTLNPSSTEVPMYIESSPTWTNTTNFVKDYATQAKVTTFLADNPAGWDVDTLLTRQVEPSQRRAVEALLAKVRVANELTAIQVPDLRDPSKPAWLELELVDSNVTETFIADLVDYLDGGPSVEKALGLYQDLLSTLRSVGIVLEDKKENDFLAALQAGDNGLWDVELGSPADENHGTDNHHSLTMDLRTGTFVVSCSLQSANRNDVAEKWDEALMLAQMTGQESTLLAYAKKYAEDETKARAKRILAERKTGKVG